MDKEYFASINDVSKRLSVPAHTLRYWERQFPTAIRPTTGAGGRRYYRADTVEKLFTIKELLYNRGMTIAGVKKMLHDGEFTQINIAAHETKTETPSPIRVAPVVTAINTDEIDTVINLLRQAKQQILN